MLPAVADAAGGDGGLALPLGWPTVPLCRIYMYIFLRIAHVTALTA